MAEKEEHSDSGIEIADNEPHADEFYRRSRSSASGLYPEAVHKPDEPWKKFTNRDDNYVVDPEETTSFRAVWREWHPEEINV